MRVSWHEESGLVVLSLWRDNVCTGSFRLAVDEVPALIELLRSGTGALLRVRPRPAVVRQSTPPAPSPPDPRRPGLL